MAAENRNEEVAFISGTGVGQWRSPAMMAGDRNLIGHNEAGIPLALAAARMALPGSQRPRLWQLNKAVAAAVAVAGDRNWTKLGKGQPETLDGGRPVRAAEDRNGGNDTPEVWTNGGGRHLWRPRIATPPTAGWRIGKGYRSGRWRRRRRIATA
jgi:hypothetical protein